MRIDKFLKVTRIIKRRTVAKDACDGGRITVNGREAKPSKELSAGDEVTVSFGNRKIKFVVESAELPKNQADVSSMYRIISDNTDK
ncbi:MAG TPA: RNA-binding S4 domain-containing protein [Eubacteriales bacterium]|jgi:ribosomal 50S subunit-recycling heat shock protein|nr:RNA-binding S4 domain-containing protein [Clostridia bacterium]HRR89229.1 RNA-binding S4 domain-containing protein [Eubacteriales bacterium]HRU85066.1 RNA-binding S4 domain-containing protein [Eubacteriales bacterium]